MAYQSRTHRSARHTTVITNGRHAGDHFQSSVKTHRQLGRVLCALGVMDNNDELSDEEQAFKEQQALTDYEDEMNQLEHERQLEEMEREAEYRAEYEASCWISDDW